MTVDDLKKMDSAMIVPAVAAAVIGCDPNNLRLVARRHPEWLGFPTVIIGNRVKIPRLPLIKFLEEGVTG